MAYNKIYFHTFSCNCHCVIENLKQYIPLYLLLFIFFFSVPLASETLLAEIKDPLKSPFLMINNDYICICDRGLYRIFVYSKISLNKITEFGEKGEGPGEFTNLSRASLYNDKLYLSHYPKLTIFSINGHLQKTLKGPTDSGDFIPFEKNFIGSVYPYSKPTDEIGEKIFILYNSNLEKKKTIFTSSFKKFVRFYGSKTEVLRIRDCLKATVFEDKLYLGSTDKGFYFTVYNSEGNFLYKINKEYKKIKISDSYKEFILNNAKRAYGEKQWEHYLSRTKMVFPTYFPAYSNFEIDKGKIYVFKYPWFKTQEVLILDIKGNLMNKVEIPLLGETGILPQSEFCLYDGRLYYIKENENSENWEIFYIDLSKKN